jgi:hypothetical protein
MPAKRKGMTFGHHGATMSAMNHRYRTRERISDRAWAAAKVAAITTACQARAKAMGEVLYWVRDWEEHLIVIDMSGRRGNGDEATL